jgi:transcriptional regulator with XRE-family HTH domain
MSSRLGTRLRILREALGWTQEDVSVRSVDQDGMLLRRVEVGQVESGRNMATTVRVRAGLARAFGVTEEDLFYYLDGQIDLLELLKRKDKPRRSTARRKSAYERAIDLLVGDGYGTVAEVRRAAADAREDTPVEEQERIGAFEWAKRIDMSLRFIRRVEDPMAASGVKVATRVVARRSV